ncbi:lysophospholipase [Fusarium oxysporum f. sp. lycopersici 4287]|uniref:Lysophospholipase n=1 Tax=Fusarium oxysporum f. sp. lycopersici (strain 4287 / CBS 123668 / FGSC 9935 / NRRL 34936) TaxID=426428 RepID=A0A0J9V791_FUSO4|nr:lysophospholipase [Fusarium oxysporum f. sp. lycopersici 4287]XP_018242827.1 lysophospholipase [Fusarium oxysporum f. sp. lycopersici 4287]XP_018244746.1 lysophospholipase [Fusarium oxysporum f. sp. lycopersici 4287]XP_018257047.1 lysophospholipase [Fusarium oxysporum f. sp. lycopersici 4287]KNB04289.1 lysophospholipase [Fusarium oxysporum f. sp. lycopersici 4287]KNB04782.1 lysophospholipase [Fusarium oxysporum f. sp. lycopersici 4287]KNB06701.1 lysophospholipase [Fusarium oxysporum f. sp.
MASPATWLELRGNNTISALKDVLTRAKIGDIDTNAYANGIVRNGSALPRIGIAISGGGYRAIMNGAGAIAAFDNRTHGFHGRPSGRYSPGYNVP